jgi:hypothetical protein
MRHVLLALATAAATLAVVSAAGARSSTAPNPCRLVTAADVTVVLGAVAGRGKLQALGLYKSCTYSTKSHVTVTVQTRMLSRANFVTSAKANPGPVKAVAGLGAPAYFAGRITLLVWRGGNEVTISIFGLGSPLAAEVKLAKRALRRM